MTQLEQDQEPLATIEHTIKTIDGSAIRSHESFEPEVHAICHHSGRYLTLKETHPKYFNLFQEQHDFPGFPELDRIFAKAAHSANYQHIIWSRHGIAGTCMIFSGVMILGMIALLQGHQDQVANLTEEIVVNIALIGGGGIGFGLILMGIIYIAGRFDKYHATATKRGERPAIDDFPLLHCHYELQANEHIRINFANAINSTPQVVSEACSLTVRVVPDMEQSRRDFDRYQALYHQHQIGQSLMAGTLALENNGTVCLDPTCPYIEYNHRLPLRAPIEQIFKQTDVHIPALHFRVPYQIDVSRRFVTDKGAPDSPLTCFVHLANSYQLDIYFYWNDQIDATYTLKECRLYIPEALQTSVEQVQSGRFNKKRQEIIWRPAGRYDITSKSVLWRDLPINDIAEGQKYTNGQVERTQQTHKALMLSVVFSQPLLQQLPKFKGTYQCVINDLISGLTLRSQSLWDARGIRITESELNPILELRTSTNVYGDLCFDTDILLQEHEYICSTRIPYRERANHALVGSILDTLVKWNVHIQRIEEATPQFDITGKQSEHLSYWEIIGSRYDLDTLDSFDIHVVITGNYQNVSQANPTEIRDDSRLPMQESEVDTSQTKIIPYTNLELTIRCLHDPRNDDVWKRADTLLQAIAQDLEPMQELVDSKDYQNHSCHTIQDYLTITLSPNGDGEDWIITAHNSASPLYEVAVILDPPPDVIASSDRFEFDEIPTDQQVSAPLTLRMYTSNDEGQTRTSLAKRIRETEADIDELEKHRRLAFSPSERKRMELELEKQYKFLEEYEHQRKSLERRKEANIRFDVTYLVNNHPIVTRDEGKLKVHLLAQ